MGLVSGITRRLNVPHEEGAWIEVRVLSWLRLEDAKRKKLNALADTMRTLSGIELPKKNGTATSEEDDDRLTEYDLGSLLRGGVVSWSYSDYKVAEVEDLDELTARWLARELLAMSLPDVNDVKKLASPSTAT